MNVSGVGATPPPIPPPPVAPPAPVAPSNADADLPGGAPGGSRGAPTRAGHGRHEPEPPALARAKVEAPPLRMLTVTEMRVMLGQLPAGAVLRPEHHEGAHPDADERA